MFVNPPEEAFPAGWSRVRTINSDTLQTGSVLHENAVAEKAQAVILKLNFALE